jgi:ligand-binding sensor domain-containing protein
VLRILFQRGCMIHQPMTKHHVHQCVYSLIAVLIFFSSCKAQSNSRGDTVKEPGKNLWYIFQDKDNSYWFGTDGDGLYRYDGKTTLHFTKKHGLCDNQIRGIQEDQSGNLFINTVRGISKYNGQTFTTLSVTENDPSANTWKLQPDDLWFPGGQDSGLVYRYDGKLLHRLRFPKITLGEDFMAKYPRSTYPAMTFNPYDVYTIYKDSKGNMWFGTGNLGACRYDGKSFMWIAEDDLTEFGDGSGNGVRSILEDKDGNFRFSNTQYRYRVTQHDSLKQKKKIMTYSREKGIGSLDGRKDGNLYDYLSAVKDDQEKIWMVTYNAGVWCYDGQKMIHYDIKEGDKTVILISIYKDGKGALWLGTQEAGVYKFNGEVFKRFKF